MFLQCACSTRLYASIRHDENTLELLPVDSVDSETTSIHLYNITEVTLLQRTLLFSCLFSLKIKKEVEEEEVEVLLQGGNSSNTQHVGYYVFIIWFRTRIETLVKPSSVLCFHALR